MEWEQSSEVWYKSYELRWIFFALSIYGSAMLIYVFASLLNSKYIDGMKIAALRIYSYEAFIPSIFLSSLYALFFMSFSYSALFLFISTTCATFLTVFSLSLFMALRESYRSSRK